MSTPKLILGSTSSIRATILKDVGLSFQAIQSFVDEDDIKASFLKTGRPIPELVQELAKEKACAIDCTNHDFVVGADQVLVFRDQLYDKPKNLDEAYQRLWDMRGQEHQLVGCVCLVQNGKMIWSHISTTKLIMRNFSEEFLKNYLAQEGKSILACVGAYKFEGRGALLFERAEGDFFSILGLSLLPLLQELRRHGVVQT